MMDRGNVGKALIVGLEFDCKIVVSLAMKNDNIYDCLFENMMCG
jgi:hypothetical protein